MSSLYKIARGMSLGVPEIGEVFYVVDTNYRTAAQGWSQADRTGPLDLWAEKNPGRVFYGAGSGSLAPSSSYPADRAAIQAMIDAQVDFRGDIGFFTPGSYSIATTALAFNVPNARYLGPAVGNARRQTVTLTDAIGDNAVSVDDNEFAYLRFVPLTAQNWFSVSDGADGGYIHDCFYNADGITADTATEFLNAAATTIDWEIKNLWVHVDAAQGDVLTLASPGHWYVHDSKFFVEGGTWASVFTFTGTPLGNLFDLLWFNGSGASSVYTNLFTGVTNSDMQAMVTRVFVNGTAMTTASAIETGFGTAADIDIADCWQTGDATLEGGVEIALA